MPRLCKKPWLETYLDYTMNQESPTAFHYWVGISVISAALGRNILIPRIKYSLRPNLYVILVAESAKCRKSSALNIGKKLLSKMEKPPLTFAQKITPEALISALNMAKFGGATYGLLFSTELAVFLSKDALNRGVTSILNDLYDSPNGDWTYQTKTGGKQSLPNPTIGMLAATTKSQIGGIIPDIEVGGGFTSRIVFVYQDRPSKQHLFNEETSAGEEIEETPEEIEMMDMLVHDLNEIQSESIGSIMFSKEAKDVAIEWYTGEMTKVRDEKLDGYYGRKHDIMFKVASILSISENSSLRIEARHITKALELLEENERNLGVIIDAVVATKTGSITEKVYIIIKKQGHITHSKLIQKCWRMANSQEMSLLIRTLIESGDIKEGTDGKDRYYEIARKPSV